MADYYPVLKRAISSLPSHSGEARRAVYEKARAALVKQLQSYNPPLSPAEITDQRLALEECIRRVESEVAGVAFGLSEPPSLSPLPKSDAKPAFTPPPAQPAPESRPRVEANADIRREAPAAPTTVVIKTPPPPPTVAKVVPETPARTGTPDAKLGVGMSALSSTLKRAESLGEASTMAVRNAREAIEDKSDAPAESKIEPAFNASGTSAPASVPIEPVRRDSSFRREVPVRRPVLPQPRRQARASFAIPALVAIIAGVVGVVVWVQRDQIAGLFAGSDATTAETPNSNPSASDTPGSELEPKILDRLPENGQLSTPVAPDARTVTTQRVEPQPAGDAVPTAPGVPSSTTAAQGAAQSQTESPADAAAPDTAQATTPPSAATDGASQDEPVQMSNAPAGEAQAPPAAEQSNAVQQRAIIYEEPLPGAPAVRLEGNVTWSFVNEPRAPGDAPTSEIRATVEVPERQLRLSLSITRNLDSQLPASHIVELKFDLPPDFSGRTIDTTPGVILKQTEEAQGDLLIGAVAKVSDNLFWVALSGADQDAVRNVALLREREWIDIPLRYQTRRRAILTFEKGPSGDQVFEQAFAAWGS
jgi:hypothetical protein